MTTTASELSLTDRAFETLRQTGNPFRNYFARNPDDEVCARFHVPELFARERAQLLALTRIESACVVAVPPLIRIVPDDQRARQF